MLDFFLAGIEEYLIEMKMFGLFMVIVALYGSNKFIDTLIYIQPDVGMLLQQPDTRYAGEKYINMIRLIWHSVPDMNSMNKITWCTL